MPLDITFKYPAPVSKPRPVSAKLDSLVTINLKDNSVIGYFREMFENPAGGDPVPGKDRRQFRVLLTDAQMEQILGIVAPAAQDQGELVPGSSVVAATTT